MNRQPYSSTPHSPMGMVARTATVLWAVVSAVNLLVWLAVSILSGDIDSPWFLYAFVTGGVIVAGLHVVARQQSAARLGRPVRPVRPVRPTTNAEQHDSVFARWGS